MEYYSGSKKKEILPFALWMDRGQYAKSDCERPILYNITYVWNLKERKKKPKTKPNRVHIGGSQS